MDKGGTYGKYVNQYDAWSIYVLLITFGSAKKNSSVRTP